MNKLVLFLTLCLLLVNQAAHAEKAAKKAAPKTVPVEYTWNLDAIFPDENAWKAEMEKLKSRLPDLKACQGHLADSADQLKKCLDLSMDLQQEMARIGTWAELKHAGDLKNAKNVENSQLAESLGAKYGEASAFVSPEISAAGREKIEKLEKKSSDLAVYHQYLRVILDQTDHLLDTSKEEMLAALGPILYGSGELQELLLSSDIKWKSIKLHDGKEHLINVVGYSKIRESTNRNDRILAFKAFYEVLGQFQHTLGGTLGLAVKRNVTLAHIRKYPNALAASLDGNKLPEEVYRQLIKQVNAGLPVFHSYLALQKKRLGVKTLEYSDVYAPSDSYEEAFPIDKAEKVVLQAVAPLGPDYQKTLTAAFADRWMDAYPREGKNPGGFMNPAAFPTHPFLLLNHQDDFQSTSTLAHEFGHAMHSVYSSHNQPYVYSDYATFIAEIASITNEVLLHEYMIKNAKTEVEKVHYLNELLKFIRTTYFRQAQFAEFELRTHEELEKGGALTGQRMTEIYGEIISKYYGQKEGVMNIDPSCYAEWAFIPHFYGGFYVFQYATSIAAAFYFAENILAGKPGAVDSYLKVLKSGSSQYPYDILMSAGIDMKSPEVYQALVERMRSAVEQIKATQK